MVPPPSPRPPASGDFTRPPARKQESPTPPPDGAALAQLATIDHLDRRFDDFCAYARFTRGHSEATVRWYRGGYRMFRDFLLQRSATLGMDIRRDFFALDEFIRSIRERGCQASTVVNYYRGLKAFFDDLETARWHCLAVPRPPRPADALSRAKSTESR
jgi:hypothetical protein